MVATLLPQLGAWPVAELALGLAALWLVAIALVSWRPVRLLEFLIGAAAGFEALQVGSLHVFSLLCFVYLVLDFQRPVEVRWPAIALVAASGTLAITSVTGDLVNTRGVGIQLVVLACSAAIVAFKADEGAARRMAYGLLATCALGAAAAVGQRVGVVPYTPFADPNQLGRVKGIWHEPDWLGMYSAIGLILAFRLRMSPWVQTAAVLFLSGGLMLSLARAAWVALVVAGLMAWWVSDRSAVTSRRRRRNRRVLAAMALTAGLVFTVNVSLRDYAVARVGALVGTQEQDIALQARANQNESLAYLASTAPWYGHGLSAAGRVSVFGGVDYGHPDNNVASNWVLGWWIDGKVLAIPLILLLCGVAVAARRTTGGLILILVLVASLASNATLVPATWFAFGLAVVGVRGRLLSSLTRRHPDAVAELV